MFSIKDITFAYEKVPVLNKISFNIRVGDWLGLLGPNGSGKTTLIKCLSGILKPKSGIIELSKRALASYPKQEFSKIIATVPQDSHMIFPFSAFEVVLMGRNPHQKLFGFDSTRDVEVAKNAMVLTDTFQFASRQFGELSGGERQRVIIARALTQEPKVLLLDEPTNFLDIRHQQEILGLLKRLNTEHGLTIVSAMHDINLALLYCKKIILIKDGCIHKFGATNEIVTYTNLKTVFETEVYVGVNDMNGKPYYLPY